MLVLSRKIGEVITIGSSVKITVVGYSRGVVRLGIEAPKSIQVHRKEVYDKIIELNKQAAKTEIAQLKDALKISAVKINKKLDDNLSTQTLVFSNNNEFNIDRRE
jgi:carbon storage regulator